MSENRITVKKGGIKLGRIIDFLRADGSIIINKKLAHAIGIDATIMYSEIISKQAYFADRDQLTEDGFFFNTVEDMEKDTALSKYQQTKAIKKLVEEHLIFHQNRGLPQKRYFKVNDNERFLIKLIDIGQKLKNSTIKSKKDGQLKVNKVDSNNTKNNTNSNKYYTVSSNSEYMFKHYEICHQEYMYKKHPLVSKEELELYMTRYKELSKSAGIDEEQWIEAVEYHFDNLPPDNNGHISYFLSGDGYTGVVRRYLNTLGY